jgi:hypothetical protein
MFESVEIVKNTLPYFQPYSIITTDSETGETSVLGDYKTRSKALNAKAYFDDLIKRGDIEAIKKSIKTELGSISKPINQLEKRIMDPNGDNHQKDFKRRIII